LIIIFVHIRENNTGLKLSIIHIS